jgi:flavin reductase (DIM6/NTAB) family NADH-FMN oxidoreductase RutF
MQRAEFSEAVKKLKHPQKIAIAFVQAQDDRYNPITIEWFMRTSITPPMFAISIAHSRFSYQCLQQFRQFNLCFPSPQQADFAMLSGSKSGFDTDKMLSIEGDWFKGRFAGLPVLKDAAANFECDVVTQVQSGDHTIFVGRVKYTWIGVQPPLTLDMLI